MDAHVPASRLGAARQPRTPLPLLLFAVLLLHLVLHIAPVQAATINTNGWMSGPAAMWSSITSDSTATTAMEAAAQQDFNDAVQAVDSGASVSVTGLSAYTAPSSGPAFGANIAFSVTTATLTAAQVLAAVRGSSMPNVNSNLNSVVGFNPHVRVLAADEPQNMASVGPVLLPLTGSTYLWQVIFDTIGASGMQTFLIPFGNDIQMSVDAPDTSYLIVPTPGTNVVNASSCYMSYSVWSYPGATVTPSTSDGLLLLAMGSTLPQFNSYVSSLETVYPTLSGFSDLFPAKIVPATPLPGDPFDGSSSSDDTLATLSTITGEYLLLFGGDTNSWARVWANKRTDVINSIESAAQSVLHRRTFVNDVVVMSGTAVAGGTEGLSGLQVLCQVIQGITNISNHPWTPEEVVSMLLQGDYSATQSLYTSGSAGLASPAQRRAMAVQPVLLASGGSASAAGSLTTTGINYNFSSTLSKEMIGIIIMAACIVGLSLITVIVFVGCCCCCPQCIRDGTGDAKSLPQSHSPNDREHADREHPAETNDDAAAALGGASSDSAVGANRDIAVDEESGSPAEGRVMRRESGYPEAAYLQPQPGDSAASSKGNTAFGDAAKPNNVGIKAPAPTTARGVPMEEVAENPLRARTSPEPRADNDSTTTASDTRAQQHQERHTQLNSGAVPSPGSAQPLMFGNAPAVSPTNSGQLRLSQRISPMNSVTPSAGAAAAATSSSALPPPAYPLPHSGAPPLYHGQS
ncbi:hypothetical protein NESM_000345600 [Novymonas esmeraldas]|uniref:Membrane-associated protein n=1 Tax=Novymonas esmeraldas TaxID=1808958 RepID=A0AAW0EMC2_9TRYP